MTISKRLIDLIWPEISTPGKKLFTPDEIKGAEFTIIASNPTQIKIQPSGREPHLHRLGILSCSVTCLYEQIIHIVFKRMSF